MASFTVYYCSEQIVLEELLSSRSPNPFPKPSLYHPFTISSLFSMWHSHFIIIEMLKTKLFKPNSVYFSNWIFSVLLTTRVEKPPKLERLQNKIPDIKFDFLLLDFIRNKCSRIHRYRNMNKNRSGNSWIVPNSNSNIFTENLWCVNEQILIGKKLFVRVRTGCPVPLST